MKRCRRNNEKRGGGEREIQTERQKEIQRKKDRSTEEEKEIAIVSETGRDTERESPNKFKM